MPFTPSHILAVVPLHRKLPLLALAIGSMVPDFGYFYPWTPYFYETAHTPVRSLTFCLPVGLLIYAFVVATRTGWTRLLPPALRVEPERFSWAWVAISIWFGALTHLFWDSFTHADGYFVEQSPGLPFRPLQHLSSAIGLAALAWMLWRRHRHGLFALDRAQKRYWVIATGFAAVFGLLRYLSPEHAGLTGQRGLFILITSCMSAALSFVAITSLVLTVFDHRQGE
jgi:hypothetical protein